MYFLLIMVVFFLAYGIPQQAILYPNEAPSWSMASRIFFMPYFQAHGELFLDAPHKSKYFALIIAEYQVMATISWTCIRK